MRIEAGEVARITSGTLHGQDRQASGVSFDSRRLLPGQAFVAVKGERDGHDHVRSAIDNGGSFAIVETGRAVAGITCVEVPDTVRALADMARDCRDRLAPTVASRVVGITGSAGKTSTKDLVHAVLSSTYPTAHASPASLNNDIGAPVTVINAPDGCEALVLEMAMRGFGEIARLCAFARPTIGVVTNVGDAHGELVGGPDGIARAKSELVRALDGTGVAILNADDDRVRAMSSLTPASVVTYGRSDGCDVMWEILSRDDQGRCAVRFAHGGTSARTTLPLPGVHMASNAAAAVAVGVVSGIALDVAVEALSRTAVAPGRVRWVEAPGGLRILDDSYNASMASMLTALDTAASVPGTNKVAVLGRIAETADPDAAHTAVAAAARALGMVVLALETDAYGSPALTVDQVVARIREAPVDVVVVKGSRVARTERVIEALVNG